MARPSLLTSTSTASALLKVLLATLAASASSTSHVLDLSYQHHLGPDRIAQSVEEGVRKAADHGGGIDIDVSSTLIGDGGCEALGRVLRSCCEEVVRPERPVEIALSARMNRMSAAGASVLLDAIAATGRREENSEGSAAQSDGIATISNDDGDDGGDDSSLSNTNLTTTPDSETVTDAKVERCSPLYISAIDLGLNYLGHHHQVNRRTSSSSRSLSKSIRTLIEGSPNSSSSKASACPRVLRLDRCGLSPSTCRAIGKGLLKASASARDQRSPGRGLERLHLSGNDLVGDSGAAALAAALRTAKCAAIDEGGGEPRARAPLLDTLDLSSCGIGDAGAEALAMALRDNPGCVRRLDLSHNRITDDGAVAIGRALVQKKGKGHGSKARTFIMESLDLSGNKDLGDDGAAALAAAIERGTLRSVSIRSCSVRSDGAASFGKALVSFALSHSQDEQGGVCPIVMNIDLSGNELGTLRAKAKSKPYSASLLKSRASATTASYMNFIGKKIKSGLKDAGLDVSQVVGNFIPSGESDDEEEAMMGLDEAEDGTQKASTARCGARSFAEAFVSDGSRKATDERMLDDNNQQSKDSMGIKCIIEMRRTFIDEGAADALAAVMVRGKDKFGIDLILDSTMNDALEKESVLALEGNEDSEVRLRSMAKRHLDAVEALRAARQRAAEAAEAAAARARAEEMMSSAFGEAEGSDFGTIPSDNYDFDAYDEYDQYAY